MKKGLRYIFVFTVITFLASCVGNKKIVYLQDQSEKSPHKVFNDTTMVSQPSAYLLEPGDVLYVKMEKFRVGEEIFTISSFEQMNRLNQVQHPYLLGRTINDEGNLTIPLVGEIEAAGKTVDDLQKALAETASKQYPGSVVEVFLMDATVSVLGEVKQPGRFPMYKRQNSVLDAIAMAGDMGDYADRSTIKVIRSNGSEEQVYHIDLNDVNALSSEGYYLENDDIVIVSPLRRNRYTTAEVTWLVSSVTALVAVASLVVSITR